MEDLNRYYNQGEQITAISYSISTMYYDNEGNLNYEVLMFKTLMLCEYDDFQMHDLENRDLTLKNSFKMKQFMNSVITDLLKEKWNKEEDVYFYSHNFFSFDSLFCLNLFFDMKDYSLHEELGNFSILWKGCVPDMNSRYPKKYYKVIIASNNNEKTSKFIFQCSFKMTNMSLALLTKDFMPNSMSEYKKNLDFPHTLFSYLIFFNMYKKKLSKWDILFLKEKITAAAEVKKKKKKKFKQKQEPMEFESWKKEFLLLENMKNSPYEELKIYVMNDVFIMTYSFFEFLKTASMMFPMKENKMFNILKISTAGSLTMWVWLIKYKKNDCFMLKPDSVSYKICQNAFYGGLTVKYSSGYMMEEENNIYMFDFSSAYVHAMMEELPYGKPKLYKIMEDMSEEESKNFFYECKKNKKCFFCYMTIKTNDFSIQGIPYKDKEKTIFPIGEWDSYYNSKDIELLFNFTENSSFIIKKGYMVLFDLSPHMKEFAKEMFMQKDMNKKAGNMGKAAIFKLLGNALYGKMGASSNNFKFTFFDDDNLVLYNHNIKEKNKMLFDKNGNVYYKTVMKKTKTNDMMNLYSIHQNCYLFVSKVDTEEKMFSSSIFMNKAIASYITSISRYYLTNANYILKKKYNMEVLYNDTDSVFFSSKEKIENQSELVWNQDLFGKNMEKFESVIFLAPKTYGLMKEAQKETIKIKGFKTKKVSYNMFKDLLTEKVKKLIITDNLTFTTKKTVKKIIFLVKKLEKEKEGKRIFLDKYHISSKPIKLSKKK